MDGALALEAAGEELLLLPGKALYWPRLDALLVADVHLGKAAAFRSAGMGVPEAAASDLARLGEIIDRSGAGALIVLGDLFHAPEGQTRTIRDALLSWCGERAELPFTLVRGNHDRCCDDLLEACGIAVCPLAEHGALTLVHDPVDLPPESGFGLCGHLHPGVRLRDFRSAFRLPCFWFGERFGALPAFGSFTGTHPIERRDDDRVIVIADDRLVEI